jgi:hypothetical protein
MRPVLQAGLGMKQDPSVRITEAKRAGGVAQVVECLPRKKEVLSAPPGLPEREREREKERERERERERQREERPRRERSGGQSLCGVAARRQKAWLSLHFAVSWSQEYPVFHRVKTSQPVPQPSSPACPWRCCLEPFTLLSVHPESLHSRSQFPAHLSAIFVLSCA